MSHLTAEPKSALDSRTWHDPTAGRQESTGWTRTHTVVLVGILLVGIALRLYSMFAFPFDQDELYTIAESRDLFRTALQPGIEARPLYYLLQHPLLAISQSEVGMRFLPTLFGVLGVAVTAIAALRLVGPFAAVGAALFATISPWHLYASGTARYFSLVYLFAAVVTWRLPIALDSERPRNFLPVAVALMVGTATHPTFAIPMAGLALAVTLVGVDGKVGWHWPSRRAWMFLWGPYAAFLTVAYIALKFSGNESAIRNWSGRGLAATLRLIPAIVEWATPAVIVLAASGAIVLVVAGGVRRRIGAMAISAAVCTPVLLFGMSFYTSVYADYAVGMLPIALVAAGGALQLIAERMRESRWLGPLLLAGVVVGGGLPSTASYLADGSRFDYRPAFARIAREAPNDPVFTWPLATQRQYAPALEGIELHLPRPRRDAVLEAARSGWAVISVKRQGIAADDDGQVAAWLTERCRRVQSWERPRFDYRSYRVELWRCDSRW